jgi:hypothetical protein
MICFLARSSQRDRRGQRSRATICLGAGTSSGLDADALVAVPTRVPPVADAPILLSMFLFECLPLNRGCHPASVGDGRDAVINRRRQLRYEVAS